MCCRVHHHRRSHPHPHLFPPAPHSTAPARSIVDGKPDTWPAGLAELKADITAFAQSFPVVGFNQAAMRYKA